jgi:hypothetical protein
MKNNERNGSMRRTLWFLSVIPLVLLTACSSDDGPMPVVSATGTVSMVGHEFTPAYGASTDLKDGTVNALLSNVATNCGTFTATRFVDGMYFEIFTSSAEKGISEDHYLSFGTVNKGSAGVLGTFEGDVEILDVTDRVITLHVDYEGAIEGYNFSAKGDFAVTRCQ